MNSKLPSTFPKADISATGREITDDSLLDTDRHDLEDHIQSLKKLDELRIKSAKLRDHGVALLKEWFKLASTNETHPPVDRSLLPWTNLDRDTFVVSTLERHYNEHKEPHTKLDESAGGRLMEQLIEYIHTGPPEPSDVPKQVLQTNEGSDTKRGPLPLLHRLQSHPQSVNFAAELLQVLVMAPASAYSKEALLCYYWIVRELFTADAPDWSIGGARTAPGGVVSAYTTAQCVHAIRAFAQAQDNTARFIDELLRFTYSSLLLQKKPDPLKPDPLKKWAEAEQKRLRYSCYVTLQRYSDTRALAFPEPGSRSSVNNVRDDVEAILRSLPTIVDDTITAFEEAKIEARDFRKVEKEALKHIKSKLRHLKSKDEPDEAAKRFQRSAFGHYRAFWALDQGLRNAKVIKKLFRRKKTHVDILEAISKTLKTVQERVRKMLQPTENYLSSVLDRELAAASFGTNSSWDPNEMVFAATSLGTLRDEWRSDVRLGEAVRYLSQAISNRGRFPKVRPYLRTDNAIAIVDPGSVIQTFGQLVRYTHPVGLNYSVVQKMLSFFDETRVNKSGIEEEDIEEEDIWHS